MDSMTIAIPRQAGIVVRREREAQGITRAQLAILAGVSERLLASLELGDAPGIQLDKLLAICKALKIELCMSPTAAQAQPEDEPSKSKKSGTSSKAVAAVNAVQNSNKLQRAPKKQPSAKAKEASTYEEAWRDFMQAQGLDVPTPFERSKEG